VNSFHGSRALANRIGQLTHERVVAPDSTGRSRLHAQAMVEQSSRFYLESTLKFSTPETERQRNERETLH
jgi:hypothetical protein